LRESDCGFGPHIFCSKPKLNIIGRRPSGGRIDGTAQDRNAGADAKDRDALACRAATKFHRRY
jgi:hypothetical protein